MLKNSISNPLCLVGDTDVFIRAPSTETRGSISQTLGLSSESQVQFIQDAKKGALQPKPHVPSAFVAYNRSRRLNFAERYKYMLIILISSRTLKKKNRLTEHCFYIYQVEKDVLFQNTETRSYSWSNSESC